MFCFCCWQFCSFLFWHRIFLNINLLSIKEENVGIYRWYIVYQETSTRYFVEKNRWKSTKNRQYIADISASSAKSPIYGKTTTKKEENRRYFSQSTRYGALSKMPFFCAVEGIWTPNKRFGVQLIRPPGQACPLLM